MRRLAILTFQTLDGVMQAPKDPQEDFSGDFSQGGWANDCWDEVMAQVGKEAMAETYDLLLGRKTYDIFSPSFSKAGPGNPAADKINKAKKYVVTSGSDELTWENSVKISDKNVVNEIRKLKQEDGPLLQVHGSWQLIQTLLANELIDEFRLWTFPVIAGSGKRLFADGAVPAKFQLTKFDTCSSGAFMHFYELDK